MDKTKISFNGFKRSIIKHSPEILIGIGIAGLVTTTLLSVKATPKALDILKEEKENRTTDLSKKEIIKLTWKCYALPTAIGSISIACIISAVVSNQRRNAALTTAYLLSESTLKDYQEKIIENIGNKKNQKIKDSMDEKAIKDNPPSKEVILQNNDDSGKTLCYDKLSGRYFKSDINTIKSVINELNKRLLTETFISVNDYYEELGLDPNSSGELLGWDIDKGLIELNFSAQLTSDDIPCMVIDHRVTPKFY